MKNELEIFIKLAAIGYLVNKTGIIWDCKIKHDNHFLVVICFPSKGSSRSTRSIHVSDIVANFRLILDEVIYAWAKE